MMVLNSSRLSPSGAAWSTSSVESACWPPSSMVAPLTARVRVLAGEVQRRSDGATAPAPVTSVDASRTARRRRASRPGVESASASSPSRVQARRAGTWRRSPTISVDGVVRLVGCAVRPFVALEQGDARRRPRPRRGRAWRSRTAPSPGVDEAQMDRLLELGAAAIRDQHAVGHEGGVELVDRVLARLGAPGSRRARPVVARGQRLGQRHDRRRRRAGRRGPTASRDEMAVRRRRAATRVDAGERAWPSATRLGDSSADGARRERRGLAHAARAGRCTCKASTPAMRQALAPRSQRRPPRAACDRRVAGQLGLGGREQLRPAPVSAGVLQRW